MRHINNNTLRDRYGDTFITILQDIVVTWKPLSIGKYLYYDNLLKQSFINSAILEEEIFKLGVTDQSLILNIDNLPAGIITTVAQNIINNSGPLDLEEFNLSLQQSRLIGSNVIHKLVPLIIRAFPAYKPEDIYEMPYETFLLRLAQAEELLLTLQVITEPVYLIDENSKPEKKKRMSPQEIREKWEAQQPKSKPITEPTKPEPKGFTPPEQSPIFVTPKDKKLKDLDKDRIETDRSLTSGDPVEDAVLRAKMIKSAQIIYKDVMDKMEFYKKKDK